MQTIITNERNIHPIFNDIERLYRLTSDEPKNTLVNPVFDNSFKIALDLIETYGARKYIATYKDLGYQSIPEVETGKNIILCISGGKDSTVAAKKYKENGYNVHLYHLRGINKTYVDEYKSVEKIADHLELQLTVESIMLSGNQCWIEHPLKNWIIAGKALQWGIKNNFGTTLVFGNFDVSTVEEEPFDVCGGDCVEMWQAYTEIIRSVVPNFEIQFMNGNFNDSLKTLEQDLELLEMTQSCIGAYRYREYLRKRNMEKYHIQLPVHRCGSCWKCCAEYIYYTDHGYYPFNREYYKHCLEVLRKNHKWEMGNRISSIEVWKEYFYYPIEMSVYF